MDVRGSATATYTYSPVLAPKDPFDFSSIVGAAWSTSAGEAVGQAVKNWGQQIAAGAGVHVTTELLLRKMANWELLSILLSWRFLKPGWKFDLPIEQFGCLTADGAVTQPAQQAIPTM